MKKLEAYQPVIAENIWFVFKSCIQKVKFLRYNYYNINLKYNILYFSMIDYNN